MDQAIAVDQLVFRLEEQQFALMQKCNIVRDFGKIAHNVRGKEYPVFLTLHKVQQQVEHIIPHNGVKPACSFVQQQ